ncbi:MAG TPA: hypothetical protein PLD82_05385 [Spirochaetota bacterium]|nr:hypothetical protein [Spirochaetota bacterium]
MTEQISMTNEQHERKYAFFKNRSFAEKMCDSRVLVNRKRFFDKKPLLEHVDETECVGLVTILDNLEERGMLADWAIGGATALSNYTIAIPTVGIDIFGHFPMADGFQAVAAWLKQTYDAVEYDAMLKIGSLYLRFFPLESSTPVDREAAAKAVRIAGGFVIFPVEYLICSMLLANQKRQYPYLLLMKSEQPYDPATLQAVLEKFALRERWDALPV